MVKNEKVVKIDSELLLQVEKFIALNENKFRYGSKKQFIDIAVLKLLKEEEKHINSIKLKTTAKRGKITK